MGMSAEEKQRLAAKMMVRFRHEPHYVFWRNVFKHPGGKEETMGQIWLNGKEPPYMSGTEQHGMNADKCVHAAVCLTYDALRSAAAAYFCVMDALGFSAREMTAQLHVPNKNAGEHTALRFPASDNHDGKPAA